MFVTLSGELASPRWIINFPTKQHWRSPTQLEWIDLGLEDLKEVIRQEGIRSVAIPALGCGNGGLDWNVVRPRIEAALADLENVDILVFEPIVHSQDAARVTGVNNQITSF